MSASATLPAAVLQLSPLDPVAVARLALTPGQVLRLDGGLLNYDFRGRARSTPYDAYRFNITEPHYDKYWGTVPGSATPSLTLNVHALDSKSITDRSRDIASAVYKALQDDHPLQLDQRFQFRRRVFGKSLLDFLGLPGTRGDLRQHGPGRQNRLPLRPPFRQAPGGNVAAIQMQLFFHPGDGLLLDTEPLVQSLDERIQL